VIGALGAGGDGRTPSASRTASRPSTTSRNTRCRSFLAVNNFEHAHHFDLAEVREALGVDVGVPILDCDARSRASVKRVLVALTEEVLARRLGRGQTVRA